LIFNNKIRQGLVLP